MKNISTIQIKANQSLRDSINNKISEYSELNDYCFNDVTTYTKDYKYLIIEFPSDMPEKFARFLERLN